MAADYAGRVSDQSASQSSRWPLVTASVVVAIEAAALAVSAVVTAALIGAGHQHDSLDAWLVVALAGVSALGLWWAWRGLVRRRRWARSPAVLVQLIALPVAYNAFGDGAWWFGVPLLACAVAGLVGLFAPSTTQALLEADVPPVPPPQPAKRKPAAAQRQRHSSTSKPSRS